MPYQSRNYRRRNDPGKAVLLGTLALVVVALVIALVIRGDRNSDVNVPVNANNLQNVMISGNTPAPALPQAQPAATETLQPEATQDIAEGWTEITPTPTPATTPASTSLSNLVDPYLMVRPVASEGFMPVFQKANYVTEKIICVTVDDFFQFTNARKIVDLALSVNGKLTLFPIGTNVDKSNDLKETLIYAWENGMEIENHTMEHCKLYDDTDELLAKHIYEADALWDFVLGKDYQMHFLRPKGGDDRNDQRTHAYIKQLGYYGIAHWTHSGSTEDMDHLLKTVEPGNIYLFHTTDNDLNRLQTFIPAVTEMGYRLVTMNEMFGYPDNEVQPLTKTEEELKQIPPLLPYTEVLVELKKGHYNYSAKKLQQRLIDLGWLEGGADGAYGDKTRIAVGYFQQAVGMEPTGVATVELQKILYSDDAPSRDQITTPLATPPR